MSHAHSGDLSGRFSDPEVAQSAQDRSQRARIAALKRWAYTDGGSGTAPARAGFDARFERLVDPESVLDPQERAERVKRARKAYFLEMARRSAEVRRAGKTSRAMPADGTGSVG